MLKLKLEHHIILFVLTFFCFLLPVSLYAESSIRVFQTQQPAKALIPTIAPLYADQAKFTATNNSLIIKAPEHILNEIENLLKQLDNPLRNLMIEVSSSLDGFDNYQQDSIEGRIKIGDDAVISSRSPGSSNPNVSVRYGKNGSVIKTTHTRRSSTRNNPDSYKIRALEGSWAFIQTGQQVPYYSSDYPYNRGDSKRRYSRPRQYTVEMLDVTSGFEVYPVLNGELVTLKVRPRNRSMSRKYPDRINTRSVDTVVSGRLGEWIYLGGAMNQINNQSSGTLYSTRRHSELDMNYRIKVNIVD